MEPVTAESSSREPGGYSVLVYPFLHRIHPTSESSTQRLTIAGRRWVPWFQRLVTGDDGGLASLHSTIDDSYFFQPSARALLFPDLVALEGQDGRYVEDPELMARAMAETLQGPQPLTERRGPHARISSGFEGRDRPSHALRLTLRDETLGRLRSLSLRGQPIGSAIEWVDLLLLPEGVGLVALKVAHGPAPVAEVVRFSWDVRHVWAPKADMSASDLVLDGRPISWRQVLEWLLAGLVDDRPLDQPDDPLDVDRLDYTASVAAQSYGTTLRALHFVYDDGARDPLETCAELIVGWPWESPDWMPSPSLVARLREQHSISYWENWTGLVWSESVAVVARPTEFTKRRLAVNWEHDYLNLMLMTLFQRVALLQFQARLDGQAETLMENVEETHRIATDIRRFRHELVFTAPVTTDLGAAIHQLMQSAFGVDVLLDGVQADAADLEAGFASEASTRLERAVTLLTFIGLPLTVFLTLFSSSVDTTWLTGGSVVTSAVWSFGLAAVTSLLLWTGYRVYVRRRERGGR